MPPHRPTCNNRANDQQRNPDEPQIGYPETPSGSRNQVRPRRLPIFHVQKNDAGDGGDNRGPKNYPSPARCQRNRIKEHIAIPPVRLARLRNGIVASALETGRTNVLRPQLQITQGADESAATLAAALKHLLWMKKACRLVR